VLASYEHGNVFSGFLYELVSTWRVCASVSFCRTNLDHAVHLLLLLLSLLPFRIWRPLPTSVVRSHKQFNKKYYYQNIHFGYLHKLFLIFIGVYLLHSGARIVQSIVTTLCKLEKGARDSSVPKMSRRGQLSTQPPIQWVKDNIFPRVKKPECEVDFSLACSAEVQGDFSYTANPPLTDMTCTETTLPLL
jgi:hypothetical protein